MKAAIIPPTPDTALWLHLDRIQSTGQNALLTPEQIRLLLADNARLIESKNVLVRELWEAARAVSSPN